MGCKRQAREGSEGKMGIYLNGTSAYGLFRRDYASMYYVDKSEMLAELIPLVEPAMDEGKKTEPGWRMGQKYVAVTRPRRFGKTVMANMIASYFGKGVDSHEEFDTMEVSKYPWYREHLNRHNVIHIAFNKNTEEVRDYDQYISMIKNTLLNDLLVSYPDVKISGMDSLWMALTKIYEYCGGEKFIFVLDEWDYLYHQEFATDRDKDNFMAEYITRSSTLYVWRPWCRPSIVLRRSGSSHAEGNAVIVCGARSSDSSTTVYPNPLARVRIALARWVRFMLKNIL